MKKSLLIMLGCVVGAGSLWVLIAWSRQPADGIVYLNCYSTDSLWTHPADGRLHSFMYSIKTCVIESNMIEITTSEPPYAEDTTIINNLRVNLTNREAQISYQAKCADIRATSLWVNAISTGKNIALSIGFGELNGNGYSYDVDCVIPRSGLSRSKDLYIYNIANEMMHCLWGKHSRWQ